MKPQEPPRRRNPCARFLLLALASAIGGCGSPANAVTPGATGARAAGPAAIAFVDVNVVPIVKDGVLEHQTVLVQERKITRVGPRDSVTVPAGAVIIDGTGKYLMPGMIDMHVHLPDDPSGNELREMLALFVSEGVTTVRGMQGAQSQLAFRAHARMDALVPNLVLAGPPISTPLTNEAARALVRAQKADGYDLVKVLGGGFGLEAYGALTDEGHKVGMTIAGHVPSEIGIDAALAAKQMSIEHLMGYDVAKREPAALEDLAKRTREAGTYNCPTLDFFAVTMAKDDAALLRRPGLEHATREQRDAWRNARKEHPPKEGASIAPHERMVALLAQAGAPLVVGSDSPGDYRVPGFSYVEELDHFSHAGLTPIAVLRAATRTAAESLGTSAHAGGVAEGMDADLVLVQNDPLANVRNVAHPAGVMLRGVWLPRADLDQRIRAGNNAP